VTRDKIEDTLLFIMSDRSILFASILIISGFTLMTVAQNASGLYVFENMWGRNGTGDGEFDWPVDIAVSSLGNVFPSTDVFVLEFDNNRIQKFHFSNPCPTGTTQVATGVCFVTKWGKTGRENGEFLSPRGVAIAPDSSIFVADTGNHRIQKFSSDGIHIRSWGTQGSSVGQFLYPYDVTVDREGNVFVADLGNNRTQKFSNTGVFIRAWGKSGTGDGEFRFPMKIDTDPSGNVFVSEGNSHRVQKFTNTGSFLTKSAPGELSHPVGIAVDTTGTVYVVDLGEPEVKIKEFTNNLQFLKAWGQTGTGPGQWSVPGNLDVVHPQFDFKHYVYLTDPRNGRVQVYFWQPDVHTLGVPGNYTVTSNATNSTVNQGIK
jgi:tripartite motif-containing protein 71